MMFITKTVLFFLGYILFAAYLSLFERKLIGRIQLRLGPTNCGACGIFQPIADAVKLFFKQNPLKGHSKQSIIAVCLLFIMSLCQLSIIPLSDSLFLINPQNGILCIIFFHAVMVFSEILIGVTSNSKYGVIGGVRAYLQLVGSHMPFVLALICVSLHANSLNFIEIVEVQESNSFIYALFPIFIIFFITGLIVMNRTPFDFPEAESELVAGAYVEYGGVLFAMIYLSDYLNIIFVSLIVSILFLGGYNPIIDIGFIPPYVWLFLKSASIMGVIILIRAILPRYRQDQMMSIAWYVFCPIILIYMLILSLR